MRHLHRLRADLLPSLEEDWVQAVRSACSRTSSRSTPCLPNIRRGRAQDRLDDRPPDRIRYQPRDPHCVSPASSPSTPPPPRRASLTTFRKQHLSNRPHGQRKSVHIQWVNLRARPAHARPSIQIAAYPSHSYFFVFGLLESKRASRLSSRLSFAPVAPRRSADSRRQCTLTRFSRRKPHSVHVCR